jgi:hypothetical protein
MRYPNWKMKNGKMIAINKMSDLHLERTMKLIERNAERERDSAILAIGNIMCTVHGEMASYYAEQDFDRAVKSDWQDFVPAIYWQMKNLLQQRQARFFNERSSKVKVS